MIKHVHTLESHRRIARRRGWGPRSHLGGSGQPIRVFVQPPLRGWVHESRRRRNIHKVVIMSAGERWCNIVACPIGLEAVHHAVDAGISSRRPLLVVNFVGITITCSEKGVIHPCRLGCADLLSVKTRRVDKRRQINCNVPTIDLRFSFGKRRFPVFMQSTLVVMKQNKQFG